MRLKLVLISFLAMIAFASQSQAQTQAARWSIEKADKWYLSHKWLTGANYIPDNAINQLEMWQEDTFSPELIDKELTLAENIEFNTLRVFLHSLARKEDPDGFKKRINRFLSIAQKHHIQPLFVFFDDCWNATPKAGKQPTPKTGVHNSGWVQDPGLPASEDTSNSTTNPFSTRILCVVNGGWKSCELIKTWFNS